MEKYNSLGALFTAIAEAIRAKTGSTDAIVANDFPIAIDGIESGGGSGGGYGDLKITDARYLFYDGGRLDLLPYVVWGETKSCKNTFSFSRASVINGTDLVLPAELDTKNVTNFESMFYYCCGLASFPLIDISKGLAFDNMFDSCYLLKEFEGYNLNVPISVNYMFRGCKALHTLKGLNLYNCTKYNGFLNDCKELKNLYLFKITASIQIGSGTSWGHLLTVDSLVHTIKELCTVTSSKTLTMGSANLEKIAGLYCKIIDDTDEQKPMELCESTDEGAMTLVDYASEKNWVIQ
jgi:hypothetical protein